MKTLVLSYNCVKKNKTNNHYVAIGFMKLSHQLYLCLPHPSNLLLAFLPALHIELLCVVVYLLLFSLTA